MILPGKHLRHDRALLGIGAEILAQLDEERTVSELWECVKSTRAPTTVPVSFDWFILSLSFLFTISAIDFNRGVVAARRRR